MLVDRTKKSAVWPLVTSLVLSAALIWRCGAEGRETPDAAARPKVGQTPSTPKQEAGKDPKANPKAKPEAPTEDPKDADEWLDNARSLVDKAKQATADTDAAIKEIKPLTEAKSVDEAAVSRVRQLADAVASLTQKGLRAKARELLAEAGKEPSKTSKDAKSLKQMVVDLEALKGKLKKDSPRLATCDSLIKELNSQWDGLKKVAADPGKDLTAATDAIYSSQLKFANDLAAQLGQLPGLDASAPGSLLFQALAADLPKAADVFRLRVQLVSRWTALDAALEKEFEHGHDGELEKIKEARKRLDDGLRAIAVRLQEKWCDTLRTRLLDEDVVANEALGHLMKAPLQSRLEVAAAVKGGLELNEQSGRILPAGRTIGIQLGQTDAAKVFPDPKQGEPGPKLSAILEELAETLTELERTSVRLGVTLTLLQENKVIDRTEWDADHIRLYYFDDVPRLLRVLAPDTVKLVGGNEELRKAADTARLALNTASQGLADARIKVGEQRNQLAARQEQMRLARLSAADAVKAAERKAQEAQRKAQEAHRKAQQAAERKAVLTQQTTNDQNAVDQLGMDLTQAKSDLTSAETGVSTAQSAYDAAKKAFDAMPKDADLKTKLEAAAKDLKAAQRNRDEARRRVNSLQTQHTNAQSRLDADNLRLAQATSEDTAAAADETAANGELTTAQMALTTAQNAQKDLDDEEKGLAAKLEEARKNEAAAETEHLGKMTAAFLAAAADNAAAASVRDNQPFWWAPPEAIDGDPVHRVILYGFPGDRTVFLRGPKEDVKAAKRIIAKFDVPSAQALLSLYTLELNSDGTTAGAGKTSKALQIVDTELRVSRTAADASMSLLRRKIGETVDKAVADYRGLHGEAIKNASDEDVAKVAFLHPEIVALLGWKAGKGDFPSSTVLRGLPRARGTTTTAEALIVLALARDEYRRQILAGFQRELRPAVEHALADLHLREQDMQEIVALLGGSGEAAQQNGFGAMYRFLGYDPRWEAETRAGRSQKLESRPEPGMNDAQHEIAYALQRAAYGPALEDFSAARQAIGNARTKYRALREDELRPILGNLEKVANENAKVLAAIGGLEIPAGVPGSEEWLQLTQARLEQSVEELQNNAREAAANEILKRMIQAVDDDLHRLFVEPMLYRMRQRLVKQAGVGVGVLQRTTVLASNRLMARVDPRANASLTGATETDALGATIQLAQIVQAGQLGGPLAALNKAERIPRDAPPGVYGITSGNLFQVTPIVDPSGQALRFRFDFLNSTQVREPSGVIDPQLSTIERHSVNTEVQLSNFEIREFSRFEADSRLGVATRKSGGIPVLKDLPVIKEIPLIGWFVKRGGQSAAVQQSLILGQTTVFPTVREVLQLLTNPSILPAGN